MGGMLSVNQYKNPKLSQQWLFKQVVHLLKWTVLMRTEFRSGSGAVSDVSETIMDVTVSRSPPAGACDLCTVADCWDVGV